jgi:hypothetical protein
MRFAHLPTSAKSGQQWGTLQTPGKALCWYHFLQFTLPAQPIPIRRFLEHWIYT